MLLIRNNLLPRYNVHVLMTYKDFIAHGVAHISNTGGIQIMFTSPMQEGVYYRFVPDKDEEVFEAPIEFDDDGNPYFMHGEVKYELSEFMRATSNNF